MTALQISSVNGCAIMKQSAYSSKDHGAPVNILQRRSKVPMSGGAVNNQLESRRSHDNNQHQLVCHDRQDSHCNFLAAMSPATAATRWHLTAFACCRKEPATVTMTRHRKAASDYYGCYFCYLVLCELAIQQSTASQQYCISCYDMTLVMCHLY